MTKSKLLKTFLVRAIAAFIIWKLAFHLVIVPSGFLNSTLTRSVVFGTEVCLELLGYDAHRDFEEKEDLSDFGVIYIGNSPSVKVADGCNGLELFALFAGFLICFPGPWRFKVMYLPVGIFLLFLLNILREMALALNYHHHQITFDFNHKYTYTIVVYMVTFTLWRHWMNRYSILSSLKIRDKE